MYARLAAEFPSVRYWIVGYEPTFPFFDCAGRRLSFAVLIPYIADTLKGIRTAVRSVDERAAVVAHFLGHASIAIEIDGRLVQPREILGALAHEIGLRGDSSSDYYDDLITSFAPDLGSDRQPEPPTFGRSGSKLRDNSTRFVTQPPFDGRTPWVFGNWSTTAYWLEEFDTATSDVVANYSQWNDWITNPDNVWIKGTTVPSAGGMARQVMGQSSNPEQTWTILGAVTHPDEDVIPFDEFGSSGDARNRWITVNDLYPGMDPDPDGIHPGAFMRVNDRPLENNQTRIGSILYGGKRTIEEPALTGSKVAFGFGPGGASPYEGSVDVERVGTGYWIY